MRRTKRRHALAERHATRGIGTARTLQLGAKHIRQLRDARTCREAPEAGDHRIVLAGEFAAGVVFVEHERLA